MLSPGLGLGEVNREKGTDLRSVGMHQLWGRGRARILGWVPSSGFLQLGGWWHHSLRQGLGRGRFGWEPKLGPQRMKYKACRTPSQRRRAGRWLRGWHERRHQTTHSSASGSNGRHGAGRGEPPLETRQRERRGGLRAEPGELQG